jgi:hypothetical protein
MSLYLTSAPSKMDPSSDIDPNLVYDQFCKIFQHNIFLMNQSIHENSSPHLEQIQKEVANLKHPQGYL